MVMKNGLSSLLLLALYLLLCGVLSSCLQAILLRVLQGYIASWKGRIEWDRVGQEETGRAGHSIRSIEGD